MHMEIGTGWCKSVMSDGQSDASTEMREGKAKLDVGNLEYFICIFMTLFLNPGDLAWDLPDPMEHAPSCLICALYLIWTDPILNKYFKHYLVM